MLYDPVELPVGHNAYFTVDMTTTDKPLWTVFDGGVIELGSEDNGGKKVSVNLDRYVDLNRKFALVLVKTGRSTFFSSYIKPKVDGTQVTHADSFCGRGTVYHANDKLASLEELRILAEGDKLYVTFADGFIRRIVFEAGILFVTTLRTDLEAHEDTRRMLAERQKREDARREPRAKSPAKPRAEAQVTSAIAQPTEAIQPEAVPVKAPVAKAAKPPRFVREPKTCGRSLGELVQAMSGATA